MPFDCWSDVPRYLHLGKIILHVSLSEGHSWVPANIPESGLMAFQFICSSVILTNHTHAICCAHLLPAGVIENSQINPLHYNRCDRKIQMQQKSGCFVFQLNVESEPQLHSATVLMNRVSSVCLSICLYGVISKPQAANHRKQCSYSLWLAPGSAQDILAPKVSHKMYTPTHQGRSG